MTVKVLVKFNWIVTGSCLQSAAVIVVVIAGVVIAVVSSTHIFSLD